MLQIICICICILCYYIAIPELLSKVFRGSMALAPHAKIFYMKVIHNRPHLASGCTTVARKDARAQIQQQKLRLEFPQGYRKGHGRTRIADIVFRGLSFLEPRHTLNKAKRIQLITMAQPGYRFSGDLTLLEICAKFLHISHNRSLLNWPVVVLAAARTLMHKGMPETDNGCGLSHVNWKSKRAPPELFAAKALALQVASRLRLPNATAEITTKCPARQL